MYLLGKKQGTGHTQTIMRVRSRARHEKRKRHLLGPSFDGFIWSILSMRGITRYYVKVWNERKLLNMFAYARRLPKYCQICCTISTQGDFVDWLTLIDMRKRERWIHKCGAWRCVGFPITFLFINFHENLV